MFPHFVRLENSRDVICDDARLTLCARTALTLSALRAGAAIQWIGRGTVWLWDSTSWNIHIIDVGVSPQYK